MKPDILQRTVEAISPNLNSLTDAFYYLQPMEQLRTMRVRGIRIRTVETDGAPPVQGYAPYPSKADLQRIRVNFSDGTGRIVGVGIPAQRLLKDQALISARREAFLFVDWNGIDFKNCTISNSNAKSHTYAFDVLVDCP
jgi:hypothetical protein